MPFVEPSLFSVGRDASSWPAVALINFWLAVVTFDGVDIVGRVNEYALGSTLTDRLDLGIDKIGQVIHGFPA